MNTPEINSSTAPSSGPASATPRGMTVTLNRTPVIYTLAGVGFIALLIATLWLAIYSTRFVPTVVNRIGSAAVYLGSVFTPGNNPSLSVIPTASTTIPFGNSTTTATTTKPVATTTPTQPVTPTPGPQTGGTYPIGGTGSVPLSGLPDFVVTINAIGYLATSSATSFVPSTTVPAGARPAVSFTIKNIGTNVTGTWRFSASIPTQTSYLYQSIPQQSLNPGDSIDYTLGFDQAIRGTNKTISVTANYDNAVAESNGNNNSAAASITILGN